MGKNKIILLNPSGCLSREATLAWLEKELSAHDAELVEKHLKECSFCREALEGLSGPTPEKVNEQLISLDEKFNKASNLKQHMSRTLIISLAAAVVVIFIGIFSILKPTPKQKSEPLAQDVSKKIPEQSQSGIQEHHSETNTQSRPSKTEVYNKPLMSVPEKKQEKETTVRNHDQELPAPEVLSAEEAVVAHASETEKEQPVIETDTPPESGNLTSSPPKAKAMRMQDVLYAEKTASASKKEDASETTFYVTDQPAVFQGGDITRYTRYIENMLKEALRNNEISHGRVVVSFIIDSQGKIKDIVVVKSLDARTDTAVVNVMKNSPLWQPAKQAGKPVNVSMSLSLNLKKTE